MSQIVQIEANLTRVDGDVERDLYALTDDGRLFSFHFDPGSTTTGEWRELPGLPA